MPPVTVVYATATVGTCDTEGVDINIREGDVWAADDPLVLAKPGLFSDTPPGPHFPRRTVPVVEQAVSPPARRRLRG